MTAIAGRRRRRTWSALLAGLLVVVAIPVLGIAGWRAIRDSKAALDVTTSAKTIPITPTALLAGVDDRGELTTLAMLTLGPEGSGGSVVAVPVGSSVTADDGTRHRLADRYASGGLEQLRIDVESLLLVTLNLAAEVDQTGLAALLAPVGDVEVDLPSAVVRGGAGPVLVGGDRDADPADSGFGDSDPADADSDDGFGDSGDSDPADSDADDGFGDSDDGGSTPPSVAGEILVESGPQNLGPETVASVLLASVDGESEVARLPANAAVWNGVAAAVGTGVAGLTPADPDAEPPATLAEFTTALWSGEVYTWQMGAAPITSVAENPTGADLLQIDLAEAIMVVATVAPSAASAVLDGASVMLTTGFTDWHITRNAIGVLAYIGANVMLVVTTDDAPPPTSEVHAGSAAVRPLAEEYAAALGADEVGAVDDPVEGIEVHIVLGQSFADAQTGLEQAPLESVPSRDTVDQNLVPTTVDGDGDTAAVES